MKEDEKLEELEEEERRKKKGTRGRMGGGKKIRVYEKKGIRREIRSESSEKDGNSCGQLR